MNWNTLKEIWIELNKKFNSTIGLKIQLKTNKMQISGEDIEKIIMNMVLEKIFWKDTNIF